METIIANGKELDSNENMSLMVHYTLLAIETLKSVHQYIDISVDSQRGGIDLALYFMSHDPECLIMTIEVGLQHIRIFKRRANQIPTRQIIIVC